MTYSPQVGKVIYSRYEIVKLLGSGGFADTYLAVDLGLPGRPHCVVKHLRPKDPNPAVLPIAKSLFQREAKILYQLGNDCNQIPQLFAHFEENNEFYLVQEFIEGHDLSHELIPGTSKNEQVVVKLLMDILKVLAFVHDYNVIHRDIKPQNIMRRAKDGKIILIDFGAVKEINVLSMASTGQTSLTVAIGSPGYMPNEQANGRPRFSSDVYAVGMIGIQALTGLLPTQLQEDSVTGEVSWRHAVLVSDNLASVLEKMIRDHFSQRYQNAQEANTALEGLSLVNLQSPQQPTTTATTNTTNKINTTNTQTGLKPRREVLKTLGWVGAGVGLSIVGGKLLQGNSTSPTPTKSTSGNLSLQSFQFETVTVDNKGSITRHQKKSAKYFVEDLGNGITLEMVQIPSRTFTMGSPTTEAGRRVNESPQHQVTVPTFFMGKYVVTQTQYEAITGNNPSDFKGANRPVEKVSWFDAVEFCKKLNQKTGRNYRLPSEAEWEYACRALTTTPFYFGETITTDLANYYGDVTPYASAPYGIYRKETTEVGKFPPNGFGLYDMHGNVGEWCQDYWHDNYQGAPNDGSAWLSGGDNTRRLPRGGSWSSIPYDCRSAYRGFITPDARFNLFSFRLVVVLA